MSTHIIQIPENCTATFTQNKGMAVVLVQPNTKLQPGVWYETETMEFMLTGKTFNGYLCGCSINKKTGKFTQHDHIHPDIKCIESKQAQ